MEKLENQAYELLHSKQNIQYNFKGYISNSDILDFYSKETPDCFIMTSESEGSPVAMQEAISFGMPVIATDVGGISEMIDGNGYLLKSNPSPKDIANSIEMLYNLTDDDYMFMRKRSLEIWEKDYDSEKNVNIFINILKNL
jgi:glycosyltransferase involved in cell wall biosynthesis